MEMVNDLELFVKNITKRDVKKDTAHQKNNVINY